MNGEDADNPRAPHPEWFDRWDSWWIFDGTWEHLMRVPDRIRHGFTEDGGLWVSAIWSDSGDSLIVDRVVLCVPVVRRGFPRSAGWRVVEDPAV